MLRREKPRRRFIDRISTTPSFIGAGMRLIGNLTCEGDLFVAGSMKGESKIHGAFSLSDSGESEGNVQAANAILAGQVRGNIFVSEKLEIRKSARIRGSVHARTIAVAEGATIDGDMGVGGDSQVIRFEEKRKENRK